MLRFIQVKRYTQQQQHNKCFHVYENKLIKLQWPDAVLQDSQRQAVHPH
jgi:hypothetical protein